MEIFIVIVLFIASVFAFMKFAPVFGGRPDAKSQKLIEASPNFNGKVFINLEPTIDMVKKSPQASMLNYVPQALFPPKGKLPKHPLPNLKFDANALKNGEFIWLGHVSLICKLDGKTIITDPVLHRAFPLPLGGKPFAYEHAITASDYPEVIDIALISHDHYDHLDYKTILELKDRIAKFLVPLGVKAHLVKWGVDEGKIYEFDWFGNLKIGNLNFTFCPSRHFSGRTFKRNTTLWGGWAVEEAGFSFYFSGDGGYGKHFKMINEKFGGFDLVFIENGAYSDGWPYVHMKPEESAQALKDLGARLGVPVHWGKFDLSYHTWDEPIKRFEKAATKLELNYATPMIGEVFSVQNPPRKKWWDEI
ncbi:MBL fold metallo-hydrolase [Campylobacter concisus]|uniref:MBL fold metallo-hydrolase n=1 Tax=Campylobacter concisus TaxID=199 RepID=UPI000CD8E8B0|nr:MBL fold metallo-hydrolase [Campylobacter concisus]